MLFLSELRRDNFGDGTWRKGRWLVFVVTPTATGLRREPRSPPRKKAPDTALTRKEYRSWLLPTSPLTLKLVPEPGRTTCWLAPSAKGSGTTDEPCIVKCGTPPSANCRMRMSRRLSFISEVFLPFAT